MNSSPPPTLVYSPNTLPIDWTGTLVRQIGEGIAASQGFMIDPRFSLSTDHLGIPSGLVTFSPDLHVPNYGRSNKTLDVSIGYEGMAFGRSGDHPDRIPRAGSMVDEIQRSGGSHVGNSALNRALGGYKERPRTEFDGAPPPIYVNRPHQRNLSVPLVPLFEFSEFYPKSSSPKAAISDLQPSQANLADDWYYNTARAAAAMPPQSTGTMPRLQSFGTYATVQAPRPITMRYGAKRRKEAGFEHRHNHVHRESALARTAALSGSSLNPSRPHFTFESHGPSGSSPDSLVQRSPHHNVGGRRKALPYSPPRSITRSPGLTPSEPAGSGYWSLSPYATPSPSRSPLGSATTPLTISSSLSSNSPRLEQDSVAGTVLKPLTNPHAFSNIPHRPPSYQESTSYLNGTSESHLHRAAASHTLGVGVTSGQPPGTTGPSTVVPRLLVSPSPIPTSSSIQGEMARFLSVSFQDPPNWWRRLVLETILQSPFLHNDEPEPLDKGSSDPITMGFGKQGRSIYGVFVEEFTKGKWRCLFGNESTPCPNDAVFKRFERAVEHVRSHLNHRPFKCDSSCNPGITACQRKFFAHQYLRDHLTRKEKTPCIIWEFAHLGLSSDSTAVTVFLTVREGLVGPEEAPYAGTPRQKLSNSGFSASPGPALAFSSESNQFLKKARTALGEF